MKNYYTALNNIIILHAISNIAEEVYSDYPDCPAAEKAFDETYKAEFEAVEKLADDISADLGGKSAARAAIWKYADEHKKAYRDSNGKLTIPIEDLHAKTADIARNYYTPDTNAIYLHDGIEYTLGADSFNDGTVKFVGFTGETLFIPACNLGSFLPGVASDGAEIIKKTT